VGSIPIARSRILPADPQGSSLVRPLVLEEETKVTFTGKTK
jgi:hypothetical protein